MKTKICTKCNKRKNINKFYKRITGIIFSECKDCKKEYNKIHDKHKCLDCDKLIWNGFERCRHCARVYQYKINPETNTFFGKKGDQSPVFKGGWKSFCIDCGKKIDFNAKRCSHHAKIYLYKDPRNHPNYINGESNFPYPIEFTESLKESIRDRDNHECQNCNMTEEEHLTVYGQVLHVHHIDYNKENCNENNLISLCGGCNTRANYNRSYWTNFYKEKVLK
jgi:hypothetical protein